MDALHATPEDSINENRALFMEWVSSESFDLKTLKKYSMECYIKELSGLFSTPNVILVDLKAFRKALDVVPHEKIENLVTAIPVYNTFLPMVLNHLMCDIDNRMSDVVFKPQNLKKWLKECDPTKFDFFKEKLSQYRINNYHFYFKKYCDKLLLTESHDKKVIAYLLLEAIQNLPKEQCVALFDSLAQLQPQLYSQIALSIYEPIKNILNNDPTKLMEYIKSDACDISFLISGLQSFVYSLNESPL